MIASLVALLALVPAPVALAPTEPAPTDVQLDWTSDEHRNFAVTWAETGGFRNKIDLVRVDGEATNLATRFAEPGQPDRVELDAGLFDVDYRIRVVVVDADGAELSEPAFSAEFDTDRTVPARITAAVPQVDGTVRFSWVPGAYTDPNPGDPLDLPADNPPRYQPVVSDPVFAQYEPLGPQVRGAGSLVVRGRTAPLVVGLQNVSNEWYGYRGATADINGSKLTAKVPSSATVGGKLRVTGKATQVLRSCDMVACEPAEWPAEKRELKLQARASASAPWQTVASTRSRTDGTYTFAVAFAGTRDYRVIAPPVPWVAGSQALAYAETPVTKVSGVTSPVADDDGGSGGGGGLSITGTPVMWIAVAGGLLVVLGVLFATLGRIRRRP